MIINYRSLLESFVCLVRKLSFVEENKGIYKKINRKFGTLIASTNTIKIEDFGEKLVKVLAPIYHEHKNDIVEKDFSFLEEGMLVFDSADIGKLYLAAVDADSETNLPRINNELLELFYNQASEEDQKLIDSKHRPKRTEKKDNDPKPPKMKMPKNMPGMPPGNMVQDIESLLHENKDILSEAEGNPGKVPAAITHLFSRNPKKMASLIEGVLGNMGISPKELAKK